MTDMNLNVAECLTSATGWTGTLVTNVCTGATTLVPHGAVDLMLGWTLGLLGLSVGVIVVLLLAYMVYDMVIRDLIWAWRNRRNG